MLKIIKKYLSKPSFLLQRMLSENAIHKTKPILTLNKPVFAGLSLLDILDILEANTWYMTFMSSKENMHESNTNDVNENSDEDK